jgi:hypothetical protein
VATAVLGDSGRYLVGPPRQVGDGGPVLARLGLNGGDPGSALLGFDFPMGLPIAYARAVGIATFPEALLQFGEAQWSEFFSVSERPEEIGPHRPFYPHSCPEGWTRSRRDLVAALRLPMPALFRRCEQATSERRAACPLFWTVGANQVGKAALAGWRELLQPALREDPPVALWPFHGELHTLIAQGRTIVAEAYPAEFYHHLGVRFGSHSGGGKRSRDARLRNAATLLQWADNNDVVLKAELRRLLHDGFGTAAQGEDPFDAVVGLFGMLNVVIGNRAAACPGDRDIRDVEGWIFGQVL